MKTPVTTQQIEPALLSSTNHNTSLTTEKRARLRSQLDSADAGESNTTTKRQRSGNGTNHRHHHGHQQDDQSTAARHQRHRRGSQQQPPANAKTGSVDDARGSPLAAKPQPRRSRKRRVRAERKTAESAPQKEPAQKSGRSTEASTQPNQQQRQSARRKRRTVPVPIAAAAVDASSTTDGPKPTIETRGSSDEASTTRRSPETPAYDAGQSTASERPNTPDSPFNSTEDIISAHQNERAQTPATVSGQPIDVHGSMDSYIRLKHPLANALFAPVVPSPPRSPSSQRRSQSPAAHSPSRTQRSVGKQRAPIA